MFEKKDLGGVCLNEGCIPTKTLLYSAKVYDYAKHGDKYGVYVPDATFDFSKITSQGVPVIASDHPVGKSTNPKDKRLRTSVLISWDNTNIAIDCSPDFRQQMLTNNVQHLEAILFTHEHADHKIGRAHV